jgi:hypothetical protein
MFRIDGIDGIDGESIVVRESPRPRVLLAGSAGQGEPVDPRIAGERASYCRVM